MITRQTTLVLGAGASIPFGFPSGLTLRNSIVARIKGERADLLTALQNRGFSREDIFCFQTALGQSGRTSVDKFLARRPDLVPIGKVAIALTLALHEDPDRLFEPERDKVNWYTYLFDKLDADWEHLAKNKLAVITFNYDRSLEHFLFTALKNSYKKSDQDCARLLKGFRIVHVHGQLGFLPWQDSQLVHDYTSRMPSNADEIADAIKIIPEATDDTDEFVQAQGILADSERIYFLGFGYDQTNLRRLGLKRLSFRPARLVRGTGLGMTDQEALDAANQSGGFVHIPDRELDALGFLRSFADLT